MDWDPLAVFQPSKPNIAQTAALEMIGDWVTRFMGDPLKVIELPNFGDLLLSKSIDYAGEEVSHALPLCLEELMPGLPDPAVGGSLDAMKVADEDNQAWLADPSKCLKPRNQWPAQVPKAKINASRSEWYRLVGELFQRNIVTTIAEDDIFRVDGVPVLNGAFAVLKSGDPGAGFSEEMEWRRDRATPQTSGDKQVSWVQYYLDDFDAPEVVPSDSCATLAGTMSELHGQQRAAYERQGVAISVKKARFRQPVVIRMGAEVDGIRGLLSAPAAKKFEVLGFSLWVLSKELPKNKALLMVLGRLVRCFEGCWPKTHVHARCPMRWGVVSALIRACIMLPMALADLRLPISGLVSASDASEKGGGLCVSENLTAEGQGTLEALRSESYKTTRCIPFQAAGAMITKQPVGPRIFVLSLFDGVAAIMCALCKLPCQVVGFAASEIDKDCKKLVRRRWPGVVELGKVETIDEKVIHALVNALGFEIDIFLISAGSPCQDLTILLAGRQGLEGSRSRLFFEIPRIYKLCRRVFGYKVVLMVENVFSMTEDSRAEFSTVLGMKPVLIEADDLSWVRRPRLYWCSWDVTCDEDETLRDCGSYLHWKFLDRRPSPDHWIQGKPPIQIQANWFMKSCDRVTELGLTSG
eukprot:s37_g25.t1